MEIHKTNTRQLKTDDRNLKKLPTDLRIERSSVFSLLSPGHVVLMNVRLLAALFAAGVLAVLPPPRAEAQELDCDVSVDYSQLQGSEYSFLGELESKVADYFNEQNWTDDRFQSFERISCSIDIRFQEAQSLTEFDAQIGIGARRPIYATTQQTATLRLRDSNWKFSYRKGAPLTHDPERYNDLTTVLDFYAYIILGYDYDSFSELGGTPYFEQARNLAQLAQSTNASGWNEVGSRGRVALVSQLLDARFEPLRKAFFRYHLAGLDRFTSETTAARETVLGVLETMQTLNQEASRRYLLDLFFASKYQELAALFEGSSMESRAYGIVSQVDAAHLSAYEQLK